MFIIKILTSSNVNKFVVNNSGKYPMVSVTITTL